MLCSDSIDDLTATVRWKDLGEVLDDAEREGSVALLHAHVPGETVSRTAIERLLSLADAHHLAFVGYDQLRPDGPGRGALALAFDDQATDAWFGIRDLLAAHHARVTFFVTRFPNYSDDMRAQLALLAGDGHDIEAHTITHTLADDYIAEHGLDAYITDEVLASFDVLRAAGYAPTSFAFPFGHATPDAIDAVLAAPGVQRLRLSPGSCPY